MITNDIRNYNNICYYKADDLRISQLQVPVIVIFKSLT